MASSADLTRGAEASISEGGAEGMRPVLQVWDLRLVNTGQSATERYRMLLSDGVHMQQAMLATQMNGIVKSGSLQKGSIVQLNEFICNVIQGRRIIIIINLEVLRGESEMIGNSKTYDNNAASASQNRAPVSKPKVKSPPAQSCKTAKTFMHRYLDAGRDMVASLQYGARFPCGYCHIEDEESHKQDDHMESFFLAEIVVNCPNLKEISLDFARQEKDSTDFVIMMDSLGRTCPRLRNIHIASIRLYNEAVFALTSANLRGLHMLSLVLGSRITDASVASIVSSFASLEFLDSSGWHSTRYSATSTSSAYRLWNEHMCCQFSIRRRQITD